MAKVSENKKKTWKNQSYDKISIPNPIGQGPFSGNSMKEQASIFQNCKISIKYLCKLSNNFLHQNSS